MGIHNAIDFDKFPAQGRYLGRRVEVGFHYDIRPGACLGTIVRDDIEDPWRTIIQLDNGKYILATECHYHLLEDFAS